MLTNGALLNDVIEFTRRDSFLLNEYVVSLVLCFITM
jgi:hypothetical protein